MTAPVTELVPPKANVVIPPPATERKPLTKKEIAADHPTWCPGCGDFSVLALYFKMIEKRTFEERTWDSAYAEPMFAEARERLRREKGE